MPEPARKNPPAYLFALGRNRLPDTVRADGGLTYRFGRLFKHDFFAATALYELEGSGVRGQGTAEQDSLTPDPCPLSPRLAVLKIQRIHPLFGLPLRWLGKRLAHNEIEVYRRLQGLAGVPRFLGAVGPTGFLHEFIPGAPLRPDHPLTPAFFDQLHALLGAIHQHDIAYVDTNKRENILFGDDGRPWLIDFQISYRLNPGLGDNPLSRLLLRRLQRADWYHFYKHKTRLLPGASTPEDFAAARRRGPLHTLHRWIADPVRAVRRRFLSRYRLENVK